MYWAYGKGDDNGDDDGGDDDSKMIKIMVRGKNGEKTDNKEEMKENE